MSQLQHPWHPKVRRILRIGGPLILLLGLALMGIGLTSFFMAMGGGGPPRYFWCGIVAMPILFVGGVMTQFGYFGAIARYLAAEQAPIACDAVNDMVDGTQDSVRKVAKAVAQGIQDARKS